MPELASTLFASKNNASGELFSGIGASDLTITLKSGEGAEFPAALTGAATSAGTSSTLNSTGIQAAGVAIGDIIYNITDGSQAAVKTVSTNSITTTILRGGTGNTWDDTDVWSVNPFLVTLNSKDDDGNITAYEIAKIISRSSDILTVQTTIGRGYNGTSAQVWDADDAVELFVVSSHNEEMIKMQADILFYLDSLEELKADTTTVNALLDARNWKNAVRVATTGAGTLASDFENGDTIDGITLATDDRILIKDQADATENGIYTVNASGAPTRADDFNQGDEIAAAVVFSEEGTANADLMWTCTNDGTVNIGVDDITFVQFTGGLTKASQVEAEAGTNNTKYMTPLSVDQALKNNSGSFFTNVAKEAFTENDLLCLERLPTTAEASTLAVLGSAGAVEKRYMKIVGGSAAASTIDIYVSKTGSPVDNLELRIETESGGFPSGTLAHANATGSIAGGSVGRSLGLETITWDGAFSLDEGTTYMLVYQRSGAVNGSNYYNIGQSGSALAAFYRTGIYNGSSWSGTDSSVFHTDFGKGLLGAALMKADANRDFTTSPAGFALATVSAEEAITVKAAGVVPGFTDLIPATTYYMSNTAGEIQTSAGSTSVKVGKAISGTELLIVHPPL